MKKLFSPDRRDYTISFGIVLIAFLVVQVMIQTGNITSSFKGQLVPICAYIVMAVSLNLTVGILGELSLGHAGFMSVGAFTGIVVTTTLADAVPFAPLRLAIAMAAGGLFAGVMGVIVGVPVLRLKGDYLAIVTLAFGQIIMNIVNVLYIGRDENGLHFSLLEQRFTLAEGGKMIINGPIGVSGVSKLSTFTAGFVLILVSLLLILNLLHSRTGRAVVLGGLGNIWGSIIAAALLTVLPELLRAVNDYRMLLYAILLIALMLFNNSKLKERLFSGRHKEVE